LFVDEDEVVAPLGHRKDLGSSRKQRINLRSIGSSIDTEPLSPRVSFPTRITKTRKRGSTQKTSCCHLATNSVILDKLDKLLNVLEGPVQTKLDKVYAAVKIFNEKLDIGIDDL
jgi:hypothetical protein